MTAWTLVLSHYKNQSPDGYDRWGYRWSVNGQPSLASDGLEYFTRRDAQVAAVDILVRAGIKADIIECTVEPTKL